MHLEGHRLYHLLYSLIIREVQVRYRGSILGVLWSLITPLLTLAVFTFVFAVVFRARWSGGEQTSLLDFALILFVGLTTFGLFAEVVTRGPFLISAQPNLVKKVVFPLELVPVVALGSALFQTTAAFTIICGFQLLVGAGVHWITVAVPVLLLPLALLTMGLGWFLAALGVYIRDVGQIVPPIVTALMFLSPIFYPVSALPEWLQDWVVYSPIAYSVEAVRDAMIFGRSPEVVPYFVALAGGLAVAGLGFAFFQKTRKGFADVL